MGDKTPFDFMSPGDRATYSRLSSEKMQHFGRNPEAFKAAHAQTEAILGPAKQAHAQWLSQNPQPAAAAPAPAASYQPAPKRTRKPPEYPPNLNPVQFERHLYHGTRQALKTGTIMTPETAATHRNFAESDTDHLFAADTPQKAAHFAKMGPQHRGAPNVYRVEPLGRVERDQWEDEGGENADLGKSYQAGGFRVLGRYTGKHAPRRYE